MKINRRRFLKSSAALVAAASCGDISQTYAHLQHDLTMLEYVPEMLDPHQITVRHRVNSFFWEYLPEEFKTAEVYRAVLGDKFYNFKYVPKEFKTPELCQIAVQNDVCSLSHVPEKLKTPELYLAAVQTDGFALWFVSDELKTPELCLAAVRNNYGVAFEYMPKEFITAEFFMKAWFGDETQKSK